MACRDVDMLRVATFSNFGIAIPLLFGALVPDKNEPSGGNKNAAGKYAQEDGPAIAGKNARSLQFEQ